MEANVLIISNNQTSVEFWNNLIKKDLQRNIILAKVRSLKNLHHFISSYTVIIIDDYFTSPNDDSYVIERALEIRRINQQCKIFALSPCYADAENRTRQIIVSMDRYTLSNDLILTLNQEIQNRFNNLQNIAI
jgi:hypothetical protein